MKHNKINIDCLYQATVTVIVTHLIPTLPSGVKLTLSHHISFQPKGPRET